ncbi:ATP-dependent Clp endopeptidase, proteolytic subunit [Salmonella phage SSBI34]|nr:ATP-dependent Clp endopeptidase, proteolytic subunit [Salmonella phage SSBI34]
MKAKRLMESFTTLSDSKGEFVDQGIYATVEHRKLMELKNSGAVDSDQLELLANIKFCHIKSEIKSIRRQQKEDKGWFFKLMDLSLPIDQEVDLMFTTRQELVDHLVAIDVPSDLCPITDTDKEEFLFFDRAARYAAEARRVLDMFKRHHEVIVDSDRSMVIEWILQNAQRIREELEKGGLIMGDQLLPENVKMIWSRSEERHDWRIHLTELGDHPANHIEPVDLIRNAGEHDTITIYITSPGGYLSIASMYTSAIKASKAKVKTVAVGEVASAAVNIFLSGHERVIEDGCYLMFHNAQLSLGGDSANIKTRVDFYAQEFKNQFHDLYSEILTDEELSRLFDHAGEVYLNAEDARSRLGGGKKEVKASDSIIFPFPTQEIDKGDEFDITLDNGKKKTFSLGKLRTKDFDEYTPSELIEIARAFDINYLSVHDNPEYIRQEIVWRLKEKV